jgi:hypothetical protein
MSPCRCERPCALLARESRWSSVLTGWNPHQDLKCSAAHGPKCSTLPQGQRGSVSRYPQADARGSQYLRLWTQGAARTSPTCQGGLRGRGMAPPGDRRGRCENKSLSVPAPGHEQHMLSQYSPGRISDGFRPAHRPGFVMRRCAYGRSGCTTHAWCAVADVSRKLIAPVFNIDGLELKPVTQGRRT